MKLAPDWSIGKVEKALDLGNEIELRQFLDARYRALFFEPLDVLSMGSRKRKSNSSDAEEYWQFGFAITSLCCLLVETLHCYRAGLPSTHRGELKQLHKKNIPP